MKIPRMTLMGLATALGLFASSAHALYSTNPAAVVADPVVNLGGGQWSYQYMVTNTTVCRFDCGNTVGGVPIGQGAASIRSFSLPYFEDAGITALMAPAGWTVAITDANSFELLGAKTLVWTASVLNPIAGIALGASKAGFGYQAGFAAGKGPFSTTLGNGGVFVGDPAIPWSPMAISAGITPVPEPSPAALLALGLAASVAWQRRRLPRRSA